MTIFNETMEDDPLLDTNENVKIKNFSTLVFFLIALFTITFLCIALGTTHTCGGLIIDQVNTDIPEVIKSDKGVVAADDRRCSEVGVEILRQGGHAVDAAVATALCVGVVNPMASGIGGGSFMVVRSVSPAQVVAFDMREIAPLAASEDMYENNPDAKTNGPLAMGIPGELAGLHKAWEKYGRLPWKTLFKPSIHFAKNGFEVFPYLGAYFIKYKEKIMGDTGLRRVFAPNGRLLRTGDICYNVELAQTLDMVAEYGPTVFYDGVVGEKLVKDVKELGGILTMEDLRNYEVKVDDALEVEVMGYKIFGMPPPSSGTLGMSLILNILNNYGNLNAVEGSLGLHRVIEAIKHMFAVRTNLGDPAFVDVSKYISDMTSSSFAKELWRKINDSTTFPPEYYLTRWSQVQDNGTSHFCIVDAERNAVSMTTTVNYPFGAGVLSPSTGVILNNEMDDFSIPTDVNPNKLPPAPANFIRPRKRPLSSMTPLIILKDDQLAGVIGGSGGLNIIPAVTQVFLNHFVLGFDPFTAVRSPRIYHKLIPNVVSYENVTVIDGEHIELAKEKKVFLEERGHEVKPIGTAAICQLIVQTFETVSVGRKTLRDRNGDISIGTLTAVSDPRKDGRPAAM